VSGKVKASRHDPAMPETAALLPVAGNRLPISATCDPLGLHYAGADLENKPLSGWALDPSIPAVHRRGLLLWRGLRIDAIACDILAELVGHLFFIEPKQLFIILNLLKLKWIF
jgi:hypothetical protein